MRVGITILILHLIQTIYCYLSPDDYRDYDQVQEDFSSTTFYNYFNMNLRYFDNKPELYIRQCKEGSFFGLFQVGNISKYFDYDNYGAIAINFNVVVSKESLKTYTNDALQFFINNQLNSELRFDNFTLNHNPSQEVQLCSKNKYQFNVSLIYTNPSTANQYYPILFTIATKFNMKSMIEWGINNIQVIKIKCPPKCDVCDNKQCRFCNSAIKHVMKVNACGCSEQDAFDYGDVDKPLTCKRIIFI